MDGIGSGTLLTPLGVIILGRPQVRSIISSGCTIWATTDNVVLYAVWNTAMPSAKQVFKLVLELRIECHCHEVYLHSMQIPGDRRIACGMDGWSRGNHDAGVLLGHDIRQYIPLQHGAFDREGPRLEAWCKSWMGKDYTAPMLPEGWFFE